MIVDRRKTSTGKSTGSRKKFLDRYKRHIKKSIDKVMDKRKIEDMSKGGDIILDGAIINEPVFEHDSETGQKNWVLPGNKKYHKGDKIKKDKS